MKKRSQVVLFFVCGCFVLTAITCLVFAQQAGTAAAGKAEPAEQAVSSVNPQEAIHQEEADTPEVVTDKSQAQEPGSKEEVISYVGADKCKVCHPQEYKDQVARKFSKSWKILKMRGEQNNPECVKCHVTGAGRPGGFISAEQTPHLTGKQCESCHGPGGQHAKTPNDPAVREKLKVSGKEKNICLECHLCMVTHRTVKF